MNRVVILLLLLPITICAAKDDAKDVSKDGKLDDYDASEIADKLPTEILDLRGYESEVHYAHTPDGYKIHVVRIINPLIKKTNVHLKRPVIFNHGFLECSSIWLINSRHVRPTFDSEICPEEIFDLQSIRKRNDSINGPMLLANHGYDVWLMSMRGTELSQDHDNLNRSDIKFWDYCLDNFALGDVPSVVHYVRQITSAPKVAYVGHSQATFSIFALLAAKPDYADIIEPVFAVAPVAYMHHTNSIARPLFVSSLRYPTRQGPYPRFSKQMRDNLSKLCRILPFQFTCKMMDAIIGGRGRGPLAGYYSHLPFTSSLKVVRHFGQIVTKKNFTRYDHGEKENLRRYGAKEAPLYPIENIRSRSICLFATKTDTLSHPADVDLFKAQLRVPLMQDVFIEQNFNHFDLITHIDARHLVFGPILEILENTERQSGFCSNEVIQPTEQVVY